MTTPASDLIGLLLLLERYQFLVDYLLGHYEGVEGDSETLCPMCRERPRTGHKYCDECRKDAKLRNETNWRRKQKRLRLAHQKDVA